MFDKEEMIKNAMQTLIENTDLEPGELNKNMNKVMVSMKTANKRFDELDNKIQTLLGATEDVNASSTRLAEASVQLAKAAESIGKSVNELNETQKEMAENMKELEDTLDRLETYMPEGEE